MRVLGFAWHPLRRRRYVGPVTQIGTGVDWPAETQPGDLAILVVEGADPMDPPPGWTLVRVAGPLSAYYRLVGFARRALRVPGRYTLTVFRNATLE